MTAYYFAYAIVLSGVPIAFVDNIKLRYRLQLFYFISALTFLILFAGLRSPYVDGDYLNYLAWYNDISSGSASSAEWLRDPTFSLISFLVSKIGLPYLVVTMIYALLSLPLKAYLCTLTVANRWATLYFYLLFCRFYIMSDLSEIRSAVAIPLMAISLFWACTKYKKKAMAFYIFSVAFHFSMIMVLPVFVLLLKGVNFRSRLWVLSLVPLAIIATTQLHAILEYMSNMYRLSEYLTSKSAQDELTLLSRYFAMLVLPILIGMFVFWNKLSLHYRVAVFCNALGVFFFVIFISNTVLASRFVDVFEIYAFLLFVAFMQLIRGYKRLAYMALLIVLGFGIFYTEFYLVNPYTWWFTAH